MTKTGYKIKIIHIITRIDVGGTADDITNIFRSLSPEKYDQILIYGPGQINFDGIGKNYKIPEFTREISLINDLISLWKIFKIVKNEKPALVHTHSSKAGFLGRWAAFFAKLSNPEMKIVHTPHGHVFYGYEFSFLKTKLFIFLEFITSFITDRQIALTEGERNESVQFCKIDPKQWEVIHSGCCINKNIPGKNLEKRKEFNIPPEAVIVGTVARLAPVKGIEYLIDSIPYLKNSLDNSSFNKLSFLIVGDGPEKAKLQSKAKEYGVENKVIFTGFRKDIYELMAIMDIYVQPSLNEGMGITLIQAQAAGLPIIATRVQGIPDAIKENETALLIPSKDPISIAECIVKLIKDPEARLKMGKQGKKWVCEAKDSFPRFSPERMVYLLDKLYDSILTQRIQNDK